MIKKVFLFVCLAFIVFSCKSGKNEYKTMTAKDGNGYSYEYVTNDPTNMRLYTLKNGLKVYLSDDKTEPKLQTYIAVAAGSNDEPEDNTGLAHYLEHMLFKGTSKIGTKDWEKEKVLIAKISDLYEKYKLEKDDNERKKIYKKIDKLSFEASNYAISGEYDNMIRSIGGSGTNAHTWVNETVYHNAIPSNEIEKWLKLESERFSEMVLRLFHTELETVYEEFNMGQDRDNTRMFMKLCENIFSKTPYKRSTIGLGEHLKSPSMVAIHEFFDKYYVPNNMAICISGDLDYEKTIALIDKYFGVFEYKELEKSKYEKEEPIESIIREEIFSPKAENILFAYRLDDRGKKHYVKIMDMILSNSVAGLIDINLVKKQKVLSVGSYNIDFKDYILSAFYGAPKRGQTLEEVEELIIGQIDNLKKGNFDDWLLQAIINDLKKSAMSSYESYQARASMYYESFIVGDRWEDKLKEIQLLEDISKEDVVKFANSFYKDNYVVIYKREGKSKDQMKIDPPNITSIKLNSKDKSEYVENFKKEKSEDLKPVFVDFRSVMKNNKIKGKQNFYTIDNKVNDLFNLDFVFYMSKDNDKRLSLINYINYLGTNKYTADQISKQFYKIAIDFNLNVSNDEVKISLSGLRDNISKAIELLKHLFFNVQADKKAWEDMVGRIIKSREDSKKDRNSILRALFSYGVYGDKSQFREIYSRDELVNFDLNSLINTIKSIFEYKHDVFYYGKYSDEVAAVLADKLYSKQGVGAKEYPKAKEYKKFTIPPPKVYFADYDMVQTMVIQVAPGQYKFGENKPYYDLFREYYGAGLSSVFFREIREKQALAYYAASSFIYPQKKEDMSVIRSFVATQTAKLKRTMSSVSNLFDKMVKSESLFNNSKMNLIKEINSQRITKAGIFDYYRRMNKLGYDYDIRKGVYDKLKDIDIDDFEKFFDKNVKNKKFIYIVVGNKKDMNLKYLSKYGKVEVMDLDHIFNYR